MRPSIYTGSQTRRRAAPLPKLAVWPIHNEADYKRTRDVVDTLILVENPTPSQAARLEVMLTLMEAWEAEHHQIDLAHVSPAEILKSLLEDHGMTASDLGRLLGSRSLGSAILRGKRQLSKRHIQILCDHFRLGPSAFM
jgi:HTH-type transcriptional regulator/antitoxin HigA